MKFLFKILFKILLVLNFSLLVICFADNHNIYEIIEQLQKDIKTLEKAVYSGSFELNNQSLNNSNFD